METENAHQNNDDGTECHDKIQEAHVFLSLSVVEVNGISSLCWPGVRERKRSEKRGSTGLAEPLAACLSQLCEGRQGKEDVMFRCCKRLGTANSTASKIIMDASTMASIIRIRLLFISGHADTAQRPCALAAVFMSMEFIMTVCILS